MEEQNNNTNTTHTDISTQPTNIEMLNTFIDPNLMQNQQNAWNNVYKNYGSLPWTTKMWQEKSLAPIYSFINNHNLKINSLLDYGGGSGHIAVAMKENFDIPKVVVADISENAFNKEDLEKNNIKCQIASFPENVDGKFDSIVCWAVFHHINPTLYEPILQQFRKKLNDNGVLFLGAWSSKDKYLAGKDKAPSLYSGLSMYSIKSLEDGKVFRDVKFEVVDSGEVINDFDTKYKSETHIPDRLLQYYVLKKNNS